MDLHAPGFLGKWRVDPADREALPQLVGTPERTLPGGLVRAGIDEPAALLAQEIAMREKQLGDPPAAPGSRVSGTEKIDEVATEMPRPVIERDGLGHLLPFSWPGPQGIGKIQAAGLGIQTDRINLGAGEPLAGAGAAGL